MFIKSTPGGRNFRSPNGTDTNFTLTPNPDPVVVTPGSTTARTTQDVSYLDDTAATTDSAYNLVLQEVVRDSLARGGRWENTNPAVAQLDEATGRVTRLADGTAQVNYHTAWLSRGALLDFKRQGGQTNSAVTGYVTGSLLKHLNDSIDALLTGDPATRKPLYLGDPASRTPPTIPLNPDRWVSSVDFSCFSPWTNGYGNQMGGTLITPRHVYYNAHYSPTVDGGVNYPTYPIYFVAQDGEVVQRTLVNMIYYNAGGVDIAVAELDADVPAKIKPAKVLPTTIQSYFGSWLNGTGQTAVRFPVIGCDQEKKATVRDVVSFTASASGAQYCVQPVSTLRKAWYEDVINGDSSSPCFMLINGELVLLGGWHYGGAGGYSNFTDPAVRSALTTLLASRGSGYALTTVNLSGFPTY